MIRHIAGKYLFGTIKAKMLAIVFFFLAFFVIITFETDLD